LKKQRGGQNQREEQILKHDVRKFPFQNNGGLEHLIFLPATIFVIHRAGHNRRAVHRAYVKRALMKIPLLEDYERLAS